MSFSLKQNLRDFSIVGILLILLLSPVQAQINASHKTGKITFAGNHVGMTFNGVFEKWQASIILPPQTHPSITASFDLKSAKTGDSTYDKTLAEGDWFDVKTHPFGKFESTSIVQIDKAFKVNGKLTLRGITLPIDFILLDSGKQLEASFTINRLKYAIGVESDPDAEWVGREIKMRLIIDK